MTTETEQVDPDLAALITSVMASHDCSPGADARLWSQLVELGLADLTGGPSRDGSEAGWWEATELVAAVAGAGCSLPVGDSDLVAGWLCDTSGVGVGAALRVAWRDNGTDPHPKLHPLVERVVVLRDGQAAEVTVEALRSRLETGEWEAATIWAELGPHTDFEAQLRISLVRAVQIVAAMGAATAAAVQHANEREQFGRPLARFQAIAGLLADMAAETALARAAVHGAVATAAALPAGQDAREDLRASVAVARSCVGHGSELVARGAHQVIGAIGTTLEHRLHTYTVPMLDWRGDGLDTRTADRMVLADVVHGRLASDLDLTTPRQASSRHRGEPS